MHNWLCTLLYKMSSLFKDKKIKWVLSQWHDKYEEWLITPLKDKHQWGHSTQQISCNTWQGFYVRSHSSSLTKVIFLVDSKINTKSMGCRLCVKFHLFYLLHICTCFVKASDIKAIIWNKPVPVNSPAMLTYPCSFLHFCLQACKQKAKKKFF